MNRSRPAPKPRNVSDLESDFLYECKAAYLVYADDISDYLRAKKQFIEALQQCGRNLTRKKVEKYWTTDTRKISFEKFCEICREEKKTKEDDIIQAFRKIDLNGDGFITNDELFRVMTTRGDKMTKDEVQDIIDEVDENNDGKLDYKEFSKMILKTQDESIKLAKSRLEKNELNKKHSKATKSSKFDEGNSDDDSLHKNSCDYDEMDDSDKELDIRRKKESTSKFRQAISDEDDSESDDDIVMGSNYNLKDKFKPKPRGHQKKFDDDENNQRIKYLSEPKSSTFSKSKNLKDLELKGWSGCSRKGLILLEDDDDIVSGHSYTLNITKQTKVFLSIESNTSLSSKSKEPMDYILFILDEYNEIVECSDEKDDNGKVILKATLQRGKYRLAPYSSGYLMRKAEKYQRRASRGTDLVKSSRGKHVLSEDFKNALSKIFDSCDLDDNGTMSRDEFNIYNIRTSGELCDDPEWAVVEESIDLKNGEITKKGFYELNQLEADENEDDVEDFWVTLSSMGFNKELEMIKAHAFTLTIYLDNSKPIVTPDFYVDDKTANIGINPNEFRAYLAKYIQLKGTLKKIGDDISIYILEKHFAVLILLKNNHYHEKTIDLNMEQSLNLKCKEEKMSFSVQVKPEQFEIVHLITENEKRLWKLSLIAKHF